MLSSGFRRDCRLLAIGGGVIQDITAFLATILMRGVGWEFIPTTLLAQCDSCIGAKSSINIAAFKNQLGSFHPPRRIHLCTGLLESLGEDAVRSGMGEILKFHLVEGGATWEAVRALPPAPSLDVLEGLVWRSLEIKRRYIEADELDTGIRAILNYGHTFGHAFESVSGFAIPHGIAVALGMAAATWISHARGMIDRAHRDEVLATLRPLYGKHLEQARLRRQSGRRHPRGHAHRQEERARRPPTCSPHPRTGSHAEGRGRPRARDRHAAEDFLASNRVARRVRPCHG